MSRNLSVGQRPRGRPRRSPATIEGTATEVLVPSLPTESAWRLKPGPALPMPETQQPAAPPPIALQRMDGMVELFNAELQDAQREIARLQAENAKLPERPPEPEVEVQPFGSGPTVTITLVRNRPRRQFLEWLDAGGRRVVETRHARGSSAD